ncbi:hypothetical protein Agub_g8642, partial [Astrephomene gubernaculifera]
IGTQLKSNPLRPLGAKESPVGRIHTFFVGGDEETNRDRQAEENRMDGPNRPTNVNSSVAATKTAQATQPQEVLGLGDTHVMVVIMILLLLGLMRAAMSPCICS